MSDDDDEGYVYERDYASMVGPSPEQEARLVAAMLAGLPYVPMVRYAGVGISQMLGWEAAAEQGYPEFVALIRKLEMAEADRIMRWLGYIDAAAADGNWKAAGWLLERCHPEQYAKQSRVVIREEMQQHLLRLKAKLSPEAWSEVEDGATEAVRSLGAVAPADWKDGTH